MRCIASLSAAVVLVSILLSCGGPDGATANGEPSAPPLTSAQAGEVISDAMVVTSQALYYAIAIAPDEREIVSADGRLRLGWSEDADFLTGIGTYEITLDGYSVPPDDPFADRYAGYVLSGTILLRSSTGSHTDLSFDLQSSHPRPEQHPATTVRLELSGFPGEGEPTTVGTAQVNGQEFTFADLAAAF